MARLVLNSVCGQGWPRTPDPLTSNSQVLGLQVHTKHHAGLLPKCWRRNDFKEKKKNIFQRWIDYMCTNMPRIPLVFLDKSLSECGGHQFD